jgi:hypothetical protein
MTNRKAAAIDVQFFAVNAAQGCIQTESLLTVFF